MYFVTEISLNSLGELHIDSSWVPTLTSLSTYFIMFNTTHSFNNIQQTTLQAIIVTVFASRSLPWNLFIVNNIYDKYNIYSFIHTFNNLDIIEIYQLCSFIQISHMYCPGKMNLLNDNELFLYR